MKRFLLPLVAVTIASLLLPSVNPAYACSCARLLEDQQIRDVIDYHDIVVLAAISRPSPQDSRPDKVHIEVETVYKGPSVSRITLDQSVDTTERLRPHGDNLAYLGADCSLTLLGEPGERYLLFLSQVADDVYEPSGCSSASLGSITPSSDLERYLEGVERVTGGGTLPTSGPESEDAPLPSESEADDGVPWLAIALGSSLGAGVLAASAFVLRRRLTRR